MMAWTFEDDVGVCTVTIYGRGKTHIRLRVLAPDAISISAPKHVSIHRIQAFIAKQQPLIREQRLRLAQHATEVRHIWYRGRQLPLLQRPERHSILITNDACELPQHPDAHRQLHSLLLQDANDWLLSRWHSLLPTASTRVAICLSKAKSYWGICRTQQIKLNWRLIGAPQSVVDYVCWHEWCHLSHANHSAAFWQLVAEQYPDYPLARQWLKQYESELMAVDQLLTVVAASFSPPHP